MKRIALVVLAALCCAPAGAQDKPLIDWRNVTLGQVTEGVQRITKKRFLIEEQVDATFMRKKIRFLSDKPISSPEEIFAIYKSILQMNELTLIPAGKEGEEIWKLVPFARARTGAVPFDKGDKEPSDAFVTRLFRLKFVDPRQAHQALINLGNPQGIQMVETAGVIMVTDYDYNIKKFEDIIALLDVPKPDIEFGIVQLQNALASDLEGMLDKLVQTLVARQAGRVIPGQPSQGAEGVKIVADKRTNSILILAEPTRLEQIRDLVKQLDRQAPFETSGIYIEHLRHTNAADISKTLNSLYRISVDDKGAPSGGGSSIRPGQAVGPQAQPTSGSSSFGSQPTGGEPTIVADARSNSLIIITDRNTYRTLVEIIKRLDQVRPQVLIEATVVEVRAEDNVDIGVELNRFVDPTDRITGMFRSQFGNSQIIPSGNTFAVAPVDTQGATLALVKDQITNIGAMLKANRSKISIDVLDQPEATASDNGSATMTVKQQFPVLQQTITGTGISQTTFKEFVDASTILTISPHISEGGYLRLETQVQIEKFTGQPAVAGAPPPKSSREIKTTSVRVPSGRTVVIGGVITQDQSETLTGVPFLMEIPILGNLFRRTQTTQVRRTLYIFITCYILYDESGGDLRELTKDRKELIESMRSEGLRNLMTEERGDPVPLSTFRYRKPSEWDPILDEPRKK